jgi:transposase InsO family protein
MQALVDSGSQANYISARAVLLAGLRPLRKEESYPLHVANGQPMPGETTITHEVTKVTLRIQDHQEELDLDVFGLATHDIILGLPWLREHNPRIDWKSKTFSFECCGLDATTSQPTHQQDQMVDERKTNNNLAKGKRTSHKNGLKSRGFDSTDTGRAPPDHEVRVTEKRVTPDIPKEYKEFQHLFAEVVDGEALPKHQSWDHEIVLEEGKTPPFGPIYPLSEMELQILREKLDKDLKKGYIRPSSSPAGFPILFVPKKNGPPRMCVDYRKLNNITIKNRYPLPNITELRDRLSRAKIFTAMDLRDGYHLIRIKKGEEWKTAFRTRYGHYEYTVMPFGLTNAPATFQELINNVLRAHLDIFVVAYLDDILVYSENEEDHVEHVRTVLRCLSKYNLRVKPEKCKFHKKEVDFLGYIVGVDGVRMSEEKIKVVKEWPQPKTVKEIQSFLGFLNFNRQFIKDYSKIAIPLTKLTRKDTPFEWSKEAEDAFQTLKKASIEPPCFRIFQAGQPLRFETDASDLALGGCASQLHEGKWHPIAYYSRKFSGPEERYDVHDKELLAIVACLQHWRVYAESCSELTIFTDHKNLVNFTTTKVLNRRQVRWSEMLGQYKFKIVYTPGKDNGRADALSRRHDIAGTKEIIDTAILKVNDDGSLGPAKTLNNLMMTITHEVPEELQEAIIAQHHDDPVHGHPGIGRTMELIKRNYEFPGMKDKIASFIAKCADCQKNKHSTHAPYGEMQAMELPDAPWSDISMDFVTGLPVSRDPVTKVSYDAILIVIDRYTKQVEYIAFRKDYTAVQLAHIMNDRIIRHHGIPKSIISDRDKLFTSNFWTTLLAAIGTKKKLSTAYHPQTDGQTERTNRTMKAYLRIYVNEQQNNWVSLLPMAQMAYNNKLSESTGQTPFYANHGRHPNLFTRTFPSQKTEAAIATADELKTVHESLKATLEKAQRQSISYVNKKRKTAPQLKKGDKVYLLTKNLRTKRPNKGLDHVKVGPFLILNQKGPVTYTLDLPPDAKIHPRFHINMLEPADSGTPLQKTFHFETEEDNVFEVEEIIAHRTRNNGKEYLVKWLGYPDSDNTWEPDTNLTNCRHLLAQYHAKHRKPRRN